ncbi:glycosyltransferase [Ruoffia sp. FAM 26255]|uniref:glycosyltransferase n=1 Tax=Ruoffia sp. FAM 26255 TaxID=3259519 RepID=UPI00388B9166
MGSLNYGGLEKIAVSYFENIKSHDNEFTFVVFGNEVGDLESRIVEQGAKVIHLDHPQNNYLEYLKNINSIIKQIGPFDIIHSHVLFNSGMVIKLAHHNKVPIRIVHSHSDRSHEEKTKLKKVYNKFSRMLINLHATDTVACSYNAGKYLFGEKKFKKDGQVIVNSIEIEKYCFDQRLRNDTRKELGLVDNFVLGHTGSFSTAKNHLFILEIFAKVKEKNKAAKLLLVGDGPEKEAIINRAKQLKIFTDIIFVGKKDSVEKYLMAMDVFLFPSKFEGLGISLVEAQAANLPCVISDVIPEEAIISKYTKKISNHENTEVWVEEILRIKNFNRDYKNKKIRKYQTKNMIDQISKLYLLS